LGRSYSSDRYSFCGKGPLAIAAMNAELPPFKNGEYNSESASTINYVITPLTEAAMALPVARVCWAGEDNSMVLSSQISKTTLRDYFEFSNQSIA